MKDIKGIKKAGVFALALAGVVGVCAGLSMQKPADYHEKYEGCDLTQDVTGATRSGTYTGYIDSHEGAAYPDKVIDVDLFSYKSEGKGKIEVKDNSVSYTLVGAVACQCQNLNASVEKLLPCNTCDLA